MNIEDIRNQIINTNWAEYEGPESYSPQKLSMALLSLIEGGELTTGDEVMSKVLLAIGNNHAGTYYPVVRGALDILIAIEQFPSESRHRNRTARAILNNLYYFEPDTEHLDDSRSRDLKKYVTQKLEFYSDKYI